MFLPVEVFSNYIAIFVRADGNWRRCACICYRHGDSGVVGTTHFYYGTSFFHEWRFIPKWSVLGFHEPG